MAIITISGNIGSGKTALSTRLAEALGYDELYMGNVFRELAKEKGMTIEEFYAALKNDPEIERAVDRQQADFMKLNNDIVMQGRMAWFFAKESTFPAFNVFLRVDPKIGAERSGKRKENAGRPLEAIIKANTAREASERERYKILYDIENVQDPTHYDFVLDTSKLTEDETFKKVFEKITERIEADV